jgi:hypothetical protein
VDETTSRMITVSTTLPFARCAQRLDACLKGDELVMV